MEHVNLKKIHGRANLCERFTSYQRHSDMLRYAAAVCRCVRSPEYYDIENMRGYVSKQKNAAKVLSARYNTQTALITLVSLGKHRKTAFSLLRDSSFLVLTLLLISRLATPRPHSRRGNGFERHFIGKNVCNTTL